MKFTLSLLALLGLFLFLTFRSGSDDARPDQQMESLLPWQIQVFDDGSSAVFAIRLGHTRLAEVRRQHGEDLEIALLQGKQGEQSLEAYYARFQAGFISGKLIIRLQADRQLRERLQALAGRPIITPSGNVKFPLSIDLPPLQKKVVVESLTFIPAANLDPKTLQLRFGDATETYRESENTVHYLYPQYGLDLVHNAEGREVFQYVAPKNYQQLRGKLPPAHQSE